MMAMHGCRTVGQICRGTSSCCRLHLGSAPAIGGSARFFSAVPLRVVGGPVCTSAATTATGEVARHAACNGVPCAAFYSTALANDDNRQPQALGHRHRHIHGHGCAVATPKPSYLVCAPSSSARRMSSLSPQPNPVATAGVDSETVAIDSERQQGQEKRLQQQPPSFGRGWKPMYKLNLQDLPSLYLKLSKSRLTGLVVITAMAGYVAAPAPFDWRVFAAVSAGTGLCSAAANAVNQTMEIPYDAQMARTRSRVLVRGQLSPLHSACFALSSVVTGTAMLTLGCNSLTGALGFVNFLLYTTAYTPLKRLTIWNTWVGSVVGALPPLMGWAACTGSITSPAAWIMPLVLYSWQFPHFHGLSWARRDDYSRGGYVMTAVTDPAMCRRVALRHCAALLALGMVVPFAGLTSWWFVCGGAAVVNGYFTYLGWLFYKQSNIQSARKLFQFSLLHLIVLMGLLVIGAVSKDTTCVGHGAAPSKPSDDSPETGC